MRRSIFNQPRFSLLFQGCSSGLVNVKPRKIMWRAVSGRGRPLHHWICGRTSQISRPRQFPCGYSFAHSTTWYLCLILGFVLFLELPFLDAYELDTGTFALSPAIARKGTARREGKVFHWRVRKILQVAADDYPGVGFEGCAYLLVQHESLPRDD